MYGTKNLPKFFFHLKLSPHSTQVKGRSVECTKQKFNSGINVCTDGMFVFAEGFTNLSLLISSVIETKLKTFFICGYEVTNITLAA